jgi:MFS family permease
LRLRTLFIANCIVVINRVLSVVSLPLQTLIPFMIARFLHGLVCGIFMCTATVYLSEIAPRNLRGVAITLHLLAFQMGTLVSNSLGLPEIFGTAKRWPYLYAIALLPTLIHFCLLPFCLESPKFVYFKKNDAVTTEQSAKFFEPSPKKSNLINLSFYLQKFCKNYGVHIELNLLKTN